MEVLEIPAGTGMPAIRLDPVAHSHRFAGESYPENTSEFYAPVLAWVERYLAGLAAEQSAEFNFEIVYFNSSTSKIFMDLFFQLEEAAQSGKAVTVNWIYDRDNEAALEYGEEFAEDLVDLPFHLVEKAS